MKGWQANTRGASYTFGQDVVVEMCQKLDLDLIARAHQVVQDGYEFFANRRLVTIFSAPHYCGQFDNAGGTMSVSEDMNCSFQVSLLIRLIWKHSSRIFNQPIFQHFRYSDLLARLYEWQ